jgi:hypothetical protein
MVINVSKSLLSVVFLASHLGYGQKPAVLVPVRVAEPKSSFVAGSPIVLTVTISNTLDKQIDILGAPSADDLTYACRAHITALGSQVEVDERLRKNRTRSSFPFILDSKASMSRVFKISRRYDLIPGIYMVRLGCFYNDGTTPQESISNPIRITIDQR